MKALLIGKSGDMADSIPFCLRLRWSDADIVHADGWADAADLVRKEAPDIVLCDYSLPDMAGADLARNLRAASAVPLIVLARDGNALERTQLLDAGADDFIVCPRSALEVLSKMAALFRRTSGRPAATPPVLVEGNISIGPSQRLVTVDGKEVKLTRREFDLLAVMARNVGRVLPHRALLEEAWGRAYVDDIQLLKKYIYRLRKKLNDNAAAPRLILSERGVGYRFNRPGP